MKPKRQPVYMRLSFDIPVSVADDAAALMVARGALGSEVGKLHRRYGSANRHAPPLVRLATYFDRLSRTALARLLRTLQANRLLTPGAPVTVENITDPGWATMWMTRFEPFRVGRFLIVPPWSVERRSGTLRLVIQPGQGFGTGHHGSTYGVLRMLDELCRERRFARALDLGTGSGILAVAMRVLEVAEVTAVDIDPIAIENARENAEYNGHSAHIRFSLVPLGSLRRRFDLITANILSATLIDLAPRLKSRLAPGGRLILAGILAREAGRVVAAYLPELKCIARRTDRGWTALLMAKAPRQATR